MSNEQIARGTQRLGTMIALQGGAVAKNQYVADWSPYCDHPVELQRRVTSRQRTEGLKMGNLKLVDPLMAMDVSALVPCRKCVKCLQWRQMKWRERAIVELQRAKRSWFVTLTFSPVHLAGILLAAKGPEDKNVEAAAYLSVQRFLKRLRKGSGNLYDDFNVVRRAMDPVEFRYLAIYELGEVTGRSHYHLFLHETGNKPIFKEQIEDCWNSFVHARLVSGKDAGGFASYLTKYATKSFSIRPRASARYGKLTLS